MTKEQKYRIVVRDECIYEKVIEASSHAEAREKAEENISALKDSVYYRSDCQYPISRYAIKHFGFQYVTNEHKDANEFYKNVLLDYIKR